MLGYGEDTLTLWALRERLSLILQEFQDKTSPLDCVVFYRPSFGRHSRLNSSIFGEFDAIVASKENVYLIESKWDNLTDVKNEEFQLRKNQTLRHAIFAWYLTHWKDKYEGDWHSFVKDHECSFREEFRGHGKILASDSILANNLEFVLTRLRKCCSEFHKTNIKNVLLFFHNNKRSPTRTNDNFKIIPINYAGVCESNFVRLFGDK